MPVYAYVESRWYNVIKQKSVDSTDCYVADDEITNEAAHPKLINMQIRNRAAC